MAKTAAKAGGVAVTLTPAPGGVKALTLLDSAKVLQIVDKASHEDVRSFVKGCKVLKREIEKHYAEIKAPLNDARAKVLQMEKDHLAPIDEAIRLAEQVDLRYVREQQRIEAEAEDARRRQAEAEEQLRRAVEAEKAEAEALKLEESTNILSERERIFVDAVVAQGPITANAFLRAARIAGYKNPEQQAAKLFDSAKIQKAIGNAAEAKRLRAESEAKQAAPIVVEVEKTESQIGKVAGVSERVYYSCGAVDVDKLFEAAIKDVRLRKALMPNMVFLNGEARQLREMFEGVYTGCTLSKKEGLAG